jgi:tetratricopeptide (TPR) repeat protein
MAAGSEPTIAQLRARAKTDPREAGVQTALALAEMFSEKGDLSRAYEPLKIAARSAPKDVRLQFLSGIERDLLGYPDEALEGYLKTIELAAGSRDREALFLSEIAANIVQSLAASGVRHPERIRGRLWAPWSRRTALAAPARNAVADILIDDAYRRGAVAAAKRIAENTGCITEWRVAGPFGPRVLLGFDADDSVEPGAILKERYNLGPGRGARETATYQARGCKVLLGGGPVQAGGTIYAQSFLQVPRDGEYLLRLATPNSVALFIDGKSVRRVDRRKQLIGPATYLPITLKAGRRLVTIKLTTRSLNPVMVFSWSALGPSDWAAIGFPSADMTTPGSEATFNRYLRASLALSRGDVIEARESYRAADAGLNDSPVVLVQRGGIALSDPLLPEEVRRDEGRRFFEASIHKAKGAWSGLLQLAKIEAENGRVTEAIERLRDAIERWPRVKPLYATLFELLRQRGWHAESEEVVKKWRQRAHDHCGVLNAELAVANRLHDAADALRISEALVGCDVRSNARYSELLQRRQWAEAAVELERLVSLEPPQNKYGALLARLELAKNRGDQQAMPQIVAELRRRYPRSQTALIEQLDLLYAQGHGDQAKQAFSEALAAEPAATLAINRLGGVISGKQLLDAYRVDGAEVIEQFERSGRSYAQPQVLVFDYMVTRVFEDGSSLQLIHNINKVQSAEAVNDLGEFTLPEDARLLKLHTIKPDGRRLEPDHIEGKETISLPNLAPGDYTEFEYIRALDPPDAFNGGYISDRFYFRSFEIPFDTSHLVMIFSPDAAVTVDPRGQAPNVEEKVQDGFKVMSWKVQASAPAVAEPLSVAAREFLPSINLGVGATWDRLIDGLRDVLADRDLYDPAMRDLVRQIVGSTPESEPLVRAQRLYAWVLEQVENTNDAFAQAAVMTRARSGNRARILHYMLTLAGVRSRLALVKSAWDDATLSKLAESELYDNLLVLLEPSGTWLSTTDRFAPFGYIPAIFRGQQALLLEKGAPSVRVRQSKKAEDRQTVSLDVELRADGSARVSAVEKFFGQGAVSWRQRLQAIPAAELERRLEHEYLPRLVAGAILTSLRVSGREDPELPLQLEYTFEVGTLGRRSGDFWALSAFWPIGFAATYAQSPKRSTTALIAPSVDRELSARIKLPPGLSLARLPGDIALRGPQGSEFTQRHVRQREVVVLEQNVTLPVMRVAPQQYDPFALFCRNADQAQAKEIFISVQQSKTVVRPK